MSLTIPAVREARVIHGILVKLTVNTSTYTIANTWSPVSWEGVTYKGLGHFLGFSEIQDDLRMTNNSLQISLSGIPRDAEDSALGTYTSYVSLILDQKIKGSKVEIYRVFFDTETRELLPQSVSLRYSGYISNYTISDSTEVTDRRDTVNCVINVSSVHAVLERRIAGQRTNSTDRNLFFPGDTSMDRVIAISNTSFDFGKPYQSSGTGGGSGSTGTGGGTEYYDPSPGP